MDATVASPPSRTDRTPLRRIGAVVRFVLCSVVLGLIVALATLTLLPHLGARALIVTSGSMDPVVRTGDLAIVRSIDPTAIRAGDVITYSGYTSSGLTTHRVVRTVAVGGRLHFQTKGDANDAPDPDLAPADGVVGKVAVTIPAAGRALALLDDAGVRVLALGLPAAWFFLRSAVAMAQALHARPARSMAGDVLLAVLLMIAVGGPLVHRVRLGASVAILVDAVPIADNTFSTGTWI